MLFKRDTVNTEEDNPWKCLNDSIVWLELFIPKTTNQYTFGLTFTKTTYSCVVTVYELEILQPNEDFVTGDEVGSIYPSFYCEVYVCEKYFFPKFVKEQYQWYHPEDGMNDITAMAEVLDYARIRGLAKLREV